MPISVTESTDEMIIELFIFQYMFSFFITAHNHFLELIWIYILNQSMADLLSFSNTFMSSCILFLAAYIVLSSAKFAS